MEFKTEKAIQILQEFRPGGRFENTPSAPRALLLYGNHMTRESMSSQDIINGIKCYKYLMSKYPETKESEWGMFYCAKCLAKIGHLDQSLQLLNFYITKYPHGDFSEYVKHYTNFIKNKNQ
jgi:outer membrane protein assembly factor BamD (BamD/ComL family)